MDGNVDLTLNRDFRKRPSYDEIPRSIFKHESKIKNIPVGYIQNIVNRNLTQTQGITDFNGWITTNAASTWITTNAISTYYGTGDSIPYDYGKVCDRCGRDITRLPWQHKAYGGLCRKCHKILDEQCTPRERRIPWK